MTGGGRSSLWDLYVGEVEVHACTLEAGLLALERRPGDLGDAAALMRAAHSLKGAARVVRHDVAVRLAHAMEDCLVAVQRASVVVTSDLAQHLLEGVDLLRRLSPSNEADRSSLPRQLEAQSAGWQERLTSLLASGKAAHADAAAPSRPEPMPDAAVATAREPAAGQAPTPAASHAPAPDVLASGGPGTSVTNAPHSENPDAAPPIVSGAGANGTADTDDRLLRISALALNRVVALGSEVVVASRWVEPFASELAFLKRRVADAAASLDQLERALETAGVSDRLTVPLDRAQDELERVRGALAAQGAAFERRSQRQFAAVERLNEEVQAVKFRPFREIVEPLPRLARDLAREMGKRVSVVVEGADTGVDRDVAALLDAPLIHVIRNAIDHGLETPEEREAAGKPIEGRVVLSAAQRAGRLFLEMADDGRGVDLGRVRALIVSRGLAPADVASRLGEQEVLRFLFLPGFSTAASVTDVSGRGVGLDVLQHALQRAGGTVRIDNRPGQGLRFALELPVTLSVQRVLLVRVAGETCGVPLGRVERVVQFGEGDLAGEPGRWHIVETTGAGEPGRQTRLYDARAILGLGDPRSSVGAAVAVLFKAAGVEAGVLFDDLVGEQALAVRPLPARVGSIEGVDAAAIGDDGTPVLLLDVDDMLSVGRAGLSRAAWRTSRRETMGGAVPRRVLVVEDSPTVREIERQILEQHGFEVATAGDGLDGWAALRADDYDLVVSDVDMPRLDGLSLVRRMRQHPRLAAVPVVMVSYRERDEDRALGRAAGANAYLSKGSFHDDTFIATIRTLLGDGGHPTQD